jgi:Protease inhibitor Inh
MALRTTIPIVVCTALLAAACSGGDRFAANSNAPAGSAAAPASGPQAAAPPLSLAGRWTLSSTGTGSCAMTFGASQQDATEGTIAPGGGCPFNFFTSRKWTYTEAGLTIRDYNAQALAQLAPAGSNRLEGKTGSGQEVALSR